MTTTHTSTDTRGPLSSRIRAARAEGRVAAQSEVAVIEARAVRELAEQRAALAAVEVRVAYEARRSVRRAWWVSALGLLATALPAIAVITAAPELEWIEQQGLEIARGDVSLANWLQPLSLSAAEREVDGPADEEKTETRAARLTAPRTVRGSSSGAIAVEAPVQRCSGIDAYDPLSFCVP